MRRGAQRFYSGVSDEAGAEHERGCGTTGGFCGEREYSRAGGRELRETGAHAPAWREGRGTWGGVLHHRGSLQRRGDPAGAVLPRGGDRLRRGQRRRVRGAERGTDGKGGTAGGEQGEF